MPPMMRAIIKSRSAPGYEHGDVPVPVPGPGEILVRVELAAICGTDLHIVNWDRWAASRIKPPRIFGHEFVGRVTTVGPGVTGIQTGETVTGETHLTCKSCYYCRTGQPHLCQNGSVIGIDRDGAFAEFICFPAENAWRLKEGIPPEVGPSLNPLGNAVYAILPAGVAGVPVAVIGCGPIGLYAIQVAKIAGAEPIFAIEPNSYRLELARSLGATCCLDPTVEDPWTAVAAQTDGIGVDLAVEVSGSCSGIETALAVVRRGGAVHLIGLPNAPVPLDLADKVILSEVHLRGISGREIYRTYYQSMGLFEAGMDVTKVITHRFPFAEFDRAIDLMRTGRCGKVLLDMRA